MGDVVQLGNTPAPAVGEEAKARVVAWLREQANDIESGAARPVHKAVLVTCEETADLVRIASYGCNIGTVERCGLVTVALHDMAAIDR